MFRRATWRPKEVKVWDASALGEVCAHNAEVKPISLLGVGLGTFGTKGFVAWDFEALARGLASHLEPRSLLELQRELCVVGYIGTAITLACAGSTPLASPNRPM